MAGLSVLKVAVLAWMLSGPDIMAVQMADLARLGWDLTPAMAQQINEGLQLSARLVIAFLLAFQVLDLGKQLIKLFRQRLPVA